MSWHDVFHIVVSIVCFYIGTHAGRIINSIWARKVGADARREAERIQTERYWQNVFNEQTRIFEERVREYEHQSTPVSSERAVAKQKIERLLALANRPGTQAEGENALKHAYRLAK